MTDLFLTAFFLAFMALGLRRPFLWVLAYLYIDIVAPQKVGTVILATLPVSLIAFVAAFVGWMALDDKRDTRFSFRQFLILVLLAYCGLTTLSADFPDYALEKWAWVWKALVFAAFLPLTLHTRLRLEAVALLMILSLSTIVVNGGIKTFGGGGGYGTLRLYVDDNSGLFEGSIISAVAIAAIPLIFWLARYNTILPKTKLVWVYAWALTGACLLIPIGTQARTGLLCIALLALLSLRTTKHRLAYLGMIGAAALLAVPFLPASFVARMNTIQNHEGDQSASSRVAIWKWTLEYARDNPFGGGFAAYRGNSIRLETRNVETTGATTNVTTRVVEDKARAYHSSYFEMLGEQGWPGLLLWLSIHLSGIAQMEVLRRRWRKRAIEQPDDPNFAWQAPFATALQHAHLIYMLGSTFVGIAFQPFCYMLVGLEIGLWTYLKRVDSPVGPKRPSRPALVVPNAVAAR
jgi:probable O-glycosylation ligase (exosortase A-associated)